MDKSISRVMDAIEIIRKGGMVIMVDDEDRENEGDIVFAAEHATAEKINFMAKEARGLICLPLSPEYVDLLKLPLMDDAMKGAGGQTTAFTVSIEARYGVTTGISAADRAHTVRTAVANNVKPEDLVVPGHIFPLRAKKGGVLERSGHTEGSVDLSRLAGCKAAAVICEIMNDDGSMARMPDLIKFSEIHKLPIISIEDLIAYRLMRDSLVKIIDRGHVDTADGRFETFVYESIIDNSQHLALVKGKSLFGSAVVDVRVHRQKTFLDVFTRGHKNNNNLVDYGLKMLANSDAAALVYLSSHDQAGTFPDFKEIQNHPITDESKSHGMDSRLLGVGAQIIRSLGINKMRTHVTQQRNLKGLAGFGLEVTEHVLIPAHRNGEH